MTCKERNLRKDPQEADQGDSQSKETERKRFTEEPETESTKRNQPTFKQVSLREKTVRRLENGEWERESEGTDGVEPVEREVNQ